MPGVKPSTVSDAAATNFFAVRLSAATIRGRLLLEGGVYFVGKPVDSNDGRIKYMRAIQLSLIDAVLVARAYLSPAVSCGN